MTKNIVNAYFNIALADSTVTDMIIAKIYSTFKDIDVTEIKLYRNCYLIDSNSNSENIDGKKVLSLFVIINEIELIDYYKILKIIDATCMGLMKRYCDKFLFLDTNYTNKSKVELSEFNADHINLKDRDFLIKRFTGYDLFIRTAIDAVTLPKYGTFKLSVYAIDTDNLIDNPNKRTSTLADDVINVFRCHDYFSKKESRIFKTSMVKNVSLYPNEDNKPLSNVVEYQCEYDGCVEIYGDCINELISLAKSSRREIIGIIALNKTDGYTLKYKSHPGYLFYLNNPSDEIPESHCQIIL